MKRTYSLIAAVVLIAAAISVGMAGCEAQAHPIEVYQDGGRVGVAANSTLNCVGSVRCRPVNKAVQVTVELPDSGSGGGSARSWIQATLDCAQINGPPSCFTSTGVTPGVGVLDHLFFRVVEGAAGSDITLNTSDEYQILDGVASCGRFTLAANKTYRLTARLPFIGYSGNNGLFQMAWFDSDRGAPIGYGGLMAMPATYNGSNVGGAETVEAVFTPDAGTRVEVRIIHSSFVDSIGGFGMRTDGGPVGIFPTAFIEVLQ